MSRWFRHYAGMMRDEKLVRVAIKAKQPIERVCWIWGALLESACEVQDAGRYDFDPAEAAYFLHCDAAEIANILSELKAAGYVSDGNRISSWPIIEEIRPSGGMWSIIRRRIFERDDFTCRYCGERGGRLECDHIVPVSRGGSNNDDNLTTSCFSCNRSKRDRLLSEWRQ